MAFNRGPAETARRVFRRRSLRSAAGAVLLAWGLPGIVGPGAVAAGSRGESVALLVSFVQERLGPNIVCNGTVSAVGARVQAVRPVLFEPGDQVSGNAWTCRTRGTRKQPGKRRRVPVMRRDKGIWVFLANAAENTSVRFGTEQGAFSVELARLSTGGAKVFLEGRVRVERVPASVRLSGVGGQDEFPGITATSDGRTWVAWQSWDGRNDVLLWAVRGPGGTWSRPASLADRKGDFFQVVLAPAGATGIWAVWSENRDGRWDLWAARLDRDEWTRPVQLTRSPGSDFNQKLAVGRDGAVRVVWQAEQNGQYDIFMAELAPDGLRNIRPVTTDPGDDWAPAVAVGPDGRLAIAWDSYRNGSFDVFVRIYSSPPGPTSPKPILVAGTPRREAHAAAAYDPDGRLWIAWDDGGPNWGKHGRPRPLIHRTRRLGLACLTNGGRLVPKTSFGANLAPDLRGMWELPELTVDPAGRPVLFARHLTPIVRWDARTGGKVRQGRGIWATFVTRYDGRSWSRPALLVGSGGRNDQRVSWTWGRDGGLWAAYAGDGRRVEKAEVPINNNVWVASVPLPKQVTALELTSDRSDAQAGGDLREPKHPVYIVQANGGGPYRLLFGDLHRHTDISRCGMTHDGSLLDTYRYAMDAVRLDFLGISDHDQDILKHRYDRKSRPLQGYMWWRSEKLCDLFYVRDRFTPIYGYEHGGSMRVRGGHKNVMYAKRGEPCLEEDAPKDLFRALEGRNAVVIPHQLADGRSATDWTLWDPRWEPVAEMFQARGSYEFLGAPREARVKLPGHYVWDALAKGVKVGLIASSDHGLTHGAYACVYAKDRSRQAILEALRARRTYAATEVIVLDFRMGSAFMGQEVETVAPPRFQATVIAPREIRRIEIVRNNEFIYSTDPAGRRHRLEFEDAALPPGGKAYYYLRCIQDDGEMAWSSPIWVSRK